MESVDEIELVPLTLTPAKKRNTTPQVNKVKKKTENKLFLNAARDYGLTGRYVTNCKKSSLENDRCALPFL